MSRRRLIVLTALVFLIVVGVYMATPFARAASLIVRATDLGGRAHTFADLQAHPVTTQPRRSAANSDALKLVSFWADVLRQ